uniref:RNase_PH domain-containing protein n=1 Tax=Trichuris muris TaxID=70415 RepID=A0A5S6QU94_TRIMR
MDTQEGRSVPYSRFKDSPRPSPWNLPFPRLDEKQHFFAKCNMIPSAVGSAYMEVEKTKVMCCVTRPLETPASADGPEGSRATPGALAVTVRYAPYAKRERIHRTRRDAALEEESKIKRFVQIGFGPVVLLSCYPSSQIELTISVLQDDGNALIAALNCSTLALASGKIEMYDLLISGTMVFPTAHSEKAVLTVSTMLALEQFCFVHMEGEVTESEFREALETLRHLLATMVYPVMRSTLIDFIKDE